MMADNLTLWNTVEKTPPSHVKEITGKSYRGSSPKPHYLIHKATETFGPCGIGWGFTIADERVEEGAGGEKMHFARVRVWFKWNGERGEVEHVGGTQFSGIRKSGQPFTDEDAPKKSVTDALVKALSMIGFAGDIFMGRYDDSKYVNELRDEERQAANSQPAAKPASSAHQKRELEEIERDLLDCRTIDAVNRCADAWKELAEKQGWSRDYKQEAAKKFEARRVVLRAAEDSFPGDLPSAPFPDAIQNMMAG